jgi:O-antigen/teichoic acid export membrane protein
MSLLPLISNFFYTDKERFRKAYRMSFKFLSIFIFPVATAIAFFSKDIILFVYGDEFIAASTVLRIVIWSEVFVYFGIINKQILTASDNQALDPLFTGASAFVNIVLNIFLIPRFDIAGAAFAHVIALAVGPCMGLFLKRTNEYSRCMFAYSIKPLIGCCVGWLVIAQCHLSWLSAIALFCALYTVVLYGLKAIDQTEIDIFKAMVNPRTV